MKIAVPTDDGKTITEHFGRARSFVIFEAKDGEIISKETVDSNTPHVGGKHGHTEDAWFISALEGCQAIIAAGMGRKAIAYFEQAAIKPVFTDVTDAEEAVKAYSQGTLKECAQPDCGHP